MNTRLTITLAIALIFALPCYAQDADTDAKLKPILGIGMTELQSCDSVHDCVVAPAFDNCCHDIIINKKYHDLYFQNIDALTKVLMSPDMHKRCALIECQPARFPLVCINNQCSEAPGVR